jgi:hypothetical protein
MRDSLIHYALNLLRRLKQILVGDLQWSDVKDLARFQIPNGIRSIYAAQTGNTEEIYVKQFGFLGRLLPLNVAYVRLKSGSPILLKTLLENTDALPEARKTYQHFSDLTGTPHLIATSGEKGLELRKKLVAILPSPSKVGEVALQMTQAMIVALDPLSPIDLNDSDLYRTQVRKILLKVLLGCSLIPSN